MIEKWIRKLVREHGGWFEAGDDELIARFPSVAQKQAFLAAVARGVEARNKTEEAKS